MTTRHTLSMILRALANRVNRLADRLHPYHINRALVLHLDEHGAVERQELIDNRPELQADWIAYKDRDGKSIMYHRTT